MPLLEMQAILHLNICSDTHWLLHPEELLYPHHLIACQHSGIGRRNHNHCYNYLLRTGP